MSLGFENYIFRLLMTWPNEIYRSRRDRSWTFFRRIAPKFVLKNNYIRLDLQIRYTTIIRLYKNEKTLDFYNLFQKLFVKNFKNATCEKLKFECYILSSKNCFVAIIIAIIKRYNLI
jgi:hypothetical protein